MSRMRKTGKREQSIHKRLLSIILMFCLMLGSFTFGSGASTAYVFIEKVLHKI